MNSNKIDIIIVNYNSTGFLSGCLDSIYKDIGTDNEVTIYIVDNSPTDDVTVITRKFPEVTVWKNPVNIGFAKAVNYYIARSDSPYILILNPDTYINNGFFRSILKFIEENPKIGIVGPKIFERNGMVQGSARAFPTPMTALFGRRSMMTKLFPKNSLTLKNIVISRCDNKKFMEVDWVSGACMLVRRKAIEDVGMMDENFFLYWEDADWCKRMSERGWDVVYYPHASIVHHTGASSKSRSIRSLLDFHVSAYKFFCKHIVKNEFNILKIFVFWILSLRFYLLLIVNLMLPIRQK